MKLEEVLPAMREGRVARWDGKQFVLRKRPLPSGGFKLIESDGLGLWNEADIVADMLDGWTLEPEPKVEWPKGSFQRAMETAGVGGFIRRKSWDSRVRYSPRQCCGTWCGEPFDTLALDWEVVP